MIVEDKTIKIYLGLINTGMNKNTSQVLNFCLIPVLNNKNLKILYVENNSIDYNRLNKEFRKIYKQQILSEHDMTTILSDNFNSIGSIILFKNNITEIKNKIVSYLKEISENGKYNIKFYTNNSNDWIDFLNIAFHHNEDELPILPNNVSIYNMDAMSILSYKINDDNLINSTINLNINSNDNSDSIIEAKRTQIIFDDIIFKL